MEYGIISAVVGILLVFAFLTFLSLLVSLLTRLTADPDQMGGSALGKRGRGGRFKARAKAATGTTGAAGTLPSAGGRSGSDSAGKTGAAEGGSASDAADSGPPPWVFAAVAAYLVAEERDEARSASAWAPGAGQKGVAVDARLLAPKETE